MNRRVGGLLLMGVVASACSGDPNPAVCEQAYECVMAKGEECLHPDKTQLGYDQAQCEASNGPGHPDCEALAAEVADAVSQYMADCWDPCVRDPLGFDYDPNSGPTAEQMEQSMRAQDGGLQARECLWYQLLSPEELALWDAAEVAEWEAACAYSCPAE